MLHSVLPRAFLPPPSLCYLGGYYGEAVHPYNSVTRFVPLENTYPSIAGHHQRTISSIGELPRSVSPIPLDLSLKPLSVPENPPVTDDCETIEVDDIEDDRNEQNYSQNWENGISEENLPSPSRSYSTYDDRHYQEIQKIDESTSNSLRYRSEIFQEYSSPNSSPISCKKIQNNLTSPKSLGSIQNYQQQLLLTPQQHLQGINAPMTPPSTPSPPQQCPRRRLRDDQETVSTLIGTPKSSTADKSINQRPKRKHARRLKFDEDTSSPVSGTVILGPDEAVVTGDIDPAFNIVEVTDEARAELAKIENRLGPYQCKLCRQLHEDAFQLAQHRCSRIGHVEYRCPECDKRFSCPANLASHRRWHKPRIPSGSDSAGIGSSMTSNSSGDIFCNKCDAKFSRQAALRKHIITQHPETNNNSILESNNDTEIARGTLSSPKPMISSLPYGGSGLPLDNA